MVNPMALMQLRPLFEAFRDRHPKFVQFFGYAGKDLREGSLLEISVTAPDGKKTVTNIRVTEEDLALVEQLRQLLGSAV